MTPRGCRVPDGPIADAPVHDQVPSRKGDNTFNMPDREVKKIKGLKGCFVELGTSRPAYFWPPKILR